MIFEWMHNSNKWKKGSKLVSIYIGKWRENIIICPLCFAKHQIPPFQLHSVKSPLEYKTCLSWNLCTYSLSKHSQKETLRLYSSSWSLNAFLTHLYLNSCRRFWSSPLTTHLVFAQVHSSYHYIRHSCHFFSIVLSVALLLFAFLIVHVAVLVVVCLSHEFHWFIPVVVILLLLFLKWQLVDFAVMWIWRNILGAKLSTSYGKLCTL